MRATARRATAAALAVGALAVVVLSGAPATGAGVRRPAGGGDLSARPSSARTGACTEDPFAGGFAADVVGRWPRNRISAALYDSVTGCEYRYRPDLRITTASVLKVEIMAGVLLRGQRAGRTLTADERALVAPMIRVSADPPANALWSSLGGTAGMASLERELGLTQTRATSPWGLTSTSATDRNRVLRQLVLGEGGPYSPSTRAEARRFLLDVDPAQRWGVTAGVPDGWAVPMKDGFFPASCCGWRINTTGVVERPGRGAYVLTILSDGWATQDAGVAAVEHVAGIVADWAAASVGPHPSATRYVRRLYQDVLGRAPTYGAERARSAAVGVEGQGAAGVGAEVLASGELDRSGGTVLRLWLGGLGALPSGASYQRRAWQLRSGALSPEALADEVVGGRGWQLGGALDDPTFVDAAAAAALGRTLSSGDRAWWVARLGAGAGRGSVLLAMVSSDEAGRLRAISVRAAELFLTFLRRAPGPAELDLWSSRLASGTPLADLVAMVLRSGEYASRW